LSSEWLWLWVPVTILAAALQTGRNAVQKGLTQELGTLGATQVRFVFGLPFACLFFFVAWSVTDNLLPGFSWSFAGFVAVGAIAQIAATALMLAAMRLRDFVAVTVWIKTEPVQIAIFGVVVLGDSLGLGTALSIAVATAGVLWMVYRPAAHRAQGALNWQPVLMGVTAAAAFAVAAVAFRGAILALPEGNFLVRASWTLVCSLLIQSAMLAVWLIWRAPNTWRKCIRAWRISIWGGFLGAAASQGWFVGFALTTAANVRTLALVEVLFAYIVSRRLFRGQITRQETIGMTLIVLGVGSLLWLQT